jgi:hypothetical protein
MSMKILITLSFITIFSFANEQTLQKTMQQEKSANSQKEEFCKQEESKLVELQGFINENLTFKHVTTKEQLEDKWQNIDSTLDNFYKMLENIIPYWDGCQFKKFSNEEARLGMISISPNIGYPNATIGGWCLGEYFIPLKDVKRTKKNLKNYVYQKIKNIYTNVPTIAELKKLEDEQRKAQEQKELAKQEELKEADRVAKEKQWQEELENAKDKQQKEIRQKKVSACISSCSNKQGVAQSICINDCKRLNK